MNGLIGAMDAQLVERQRYGKNEDAAHSTSYPTVPELSLYPRLTPVILDLFTLFIFLANYSLCTVQCMLQGTVSSFRTKTFNSQ
jgi:hypothetical protein